MLKSLQNFTLIIKNNKIQTKIFGANVMFLMFLCKDAGSQIINNVFFNSNIFSLFSRIRILKPLQNVDWWQNSNPSNIYVCEICSKLTINYQKDVDVIDVILVFLLLTLKQVTPFSSISIVDFELVNFSCELIGYGAVVRRDLMTFLDVFLQPVRFTFINPFYATGLFLYPPKNIRKREVLRVFRGYRKRQVA